MIKQPKQDTVKVLFFVGINFRGMVKNYKFVDFVCVPKRNSLILYFEHDKFHWVSKLRESLNALDRWAVELCNRKWNVDIDVFIFSILKFTYINLYQQKQLLNFIIIDQCYFIEFENWNKIIWNYFMSTYIRNFH